MGYSAYATRKFGEFTGNGSLFFNKNGVNRLCANVDTKIQLKRKEIKQATNRGIYSKVAKNMEFEGKITAIAMQEFFLDLQGVDPISSVAKTVLTQAGCGAETEITTMTSQIENPSGIKVSIDTTNENGFTKQTPILIKGKNGVGLAIEVQVWLNGVDNETCHLLFSEITSVKIPAVMTATETLKIETVVTRSGFSSEVPTFAMDLTVTDDETGYVCGCNIKNIKLLDSPALGLKGEEEYMKDEISFVVSNPKTDICFYEIRDEAIAVEYEQA